MSSLKTSPQAVTVPTPTAKAPAASPLPPAIDLATPKRPAPGADFDYSEALRQALPEHGVIDWDDVAERFLAAIPNRGWRKIVRPAVKNWCRQRVRTSRGTSGQGGSRSLWNEPQHPGADASANGNGQPWFAHRDVRDAIERGLDEVWAGETGSKRLREFTPKDVVSAKIRAESTVRSGLLRVKGFTALHEAMNQHSPATVGDLPRKVLEVVVPPLFVSTPMVEESE